MIVTGSIPVSAPTLAGFTTSVLPPSIFATVALPIFAGLPKVIASTPLISTAPLASNFAVIARNATGFISLSCISYVLPLATCTAWYGRTCNNSWLTAAGCVVWILAFTRSTNFASAWLGLTSMSASSGDCLLRSLKVISVRPPDTSPLTLARPRSSCCASTVPRIPI